MGLTSNSKLTRNIDLFFSESLFFNNAYSPSGSSYRSGLSILTSTNPYFYQLDVKSFEQLRRRKTLGSWFGVYTRFSSLAEVLRNDGYHTMLVNKGVRSGKGTMLDRGFDRYQEFSIRTLIEDILPVYQAEMVSLKEPFFAMLHSVPTRLHNAYFPADRERLNHPDISYIPYKRKHSKEGLKVRRATDVSQKRQRAAEHLIYQQQLKYADEELLKFFDFISDYLDRSVVVLYSGHGTQLGDKMIYASDGSSYEPNIRVPLFIRIPNLHSSVTVSQRTSLIDLSPTLLDILGLRSPDTFEGISLLPIVNGTPSNSSVVFGKNDRDEFLIVDDWKLIIKNDGTRHLYRIGDSASTGKNYINTERYIARLLEYNPSPDGEFENFDLNNWRLEVNSKSTYELYNLGIDPLETRNLASSEVEKLNQLLCGIKRLRTEARSNTDLQRTRGDSKTVSIRSKDQTSMLESCITTSRVPPHSNTDSIALP